MRRYLAEAIGTFVLVLGGVGTAVLDAGHVGVLGVALAFGLSLLVMVYAIGPISGCHVNPAVTIGLIIAGRHDKKDFLGYVVAQIIGAILGAFVIYLAATGITGGYDVAANGFAANGYGAHSPDGYGLGAGFLAEVVLTALLVFVVVAVTDKVTPAGFAGLPIGLTLALIHLIGIPVTNVSVNPARSIGAAIIARGWALEQLWLFIVAPCLGGVLGALLYGLIRHAPGAPSVVEAEPDERALAGRRPPDVRTPLRT
jgi:aquaporin Z